MVSQHEIMDDGTATSKALDYGLNAGWRCRPKPKMGLYRWTITGVRTKYGRASLDANIDSLEDHSAAENELQQS